MDHLESEIKTAVVTIMRLWLEQHEAPGRERVTAIMLNHAIKQMNESLRLLMEFHVNANSK